MRIHEHPTKILGNFKILNKKNDKFQRFLCSSQIMKEI